MYTIGNIGHHKVVSTKLSRNGYEQGAVTSAGNTVTRMLGTFMSRDYKHFIIAIFKSLTKSPT